MEWYGLRGITLNWFKSYLNDHSMRAKCFASSASGVQYSKSYKVNIGTPQGSCLGPLLFLIFCNDIYMNLDLCKGILFTDDTTIYNSHKNIEYLKWTIIHDLAILLDWFKVNHLSMNSSKSTGMLFLNNKNLIIDNLIISDT